MTVGEEGAEQHRTEGDDYSPLVKGLGIAGAVFFSLIALVVALVALGSERNPIKWSFLKLCAGISSVAIVIPLLLVIAAAGGSSSGSNTSGPCVGGPAMGASGTPDGNGYVTFPCAISGQVRVYLGGSGTNP